MRSAASSRHSPPVESADTTVAATSGSMRTRRRRGGHRRPFDVGERGGEPDGVGEGRSTAPSTPCSDCAESRPASSVGGEPNQIRVCNSLLQGVFAAASSVRRCEDPWPWFRGGPASPSSGRSTSTSSRAASDCREPVRRSAARPSRACPAGRVRIRRSRVRGSAPTSRSSGRWAAIPSPRRHSRRCGLRASRSSFGRSPSRRESPSSWSTPPGRTRSSSLLARTRRWPRWSFPHTTPFSASSRSPTRPSSRRGRSARASSVSTQRLRGP